MGEKGSLGFLWITRTALKDLLVNVENVLFFLKWDVTSAQQWSYMVVDGKGKVEQKL